MTSQWWYGSMHFSRAIYSYRQKINERPCSHFSTWWNLIRVFFALPTIHTGHPMMTSWHGIFSALLALCEGNQRGPVMQSSDLVFWVGLHELLNKQSNARWSGTPWPLFDVIVMRRPGGFGEPRDSDREVVCFCCCFLITKEWICYHQFVLLLWKELARTTSV